MQTFNFQQIIRDVQDDLLEELYEEEVLEEDLQQARTFIVEPKYIEGYKKTPLQIYTEELKDLLRFMPLHEKQSLEFLMRKKPEKKIVTKAEKPMNSFQLMMANRESLYKRSSVSPELKDFIKDIYLNPMKQSDLGYTEQTIEHYLRTGYHFSPEEEEIDIFEDIFAKDPYFKRRL